MIVDGLSWRWLFYLVLPFALLSIIVGIAVLKNVSEVTKPRVDLLSIVLSTIGFGGIVYGFSKAGELGWSVPEVIWPIAAGGVALALFVWRQLLLKEPIMDLRAFEAAAMTSPGITRTRGLNLSNSLPETGAIIPFTTPPGSRIKPDLNAVIISTPCINIGSMIADEKKVIKSTNSSTATNANMGYRFRKIHIP
ncbi:hypothetical protein [Paenibacillus agri]|uniref:MFS transporter n=1 Tax=Paenibacillus agri TaxID=2744309 RepID=A0A850ER66_9BACL|nr:hypothetical protein [Paenibacillus agri]